jgi:hypothetical protein
VAIITGHLHPYESVIRLGGDEFVRAISVTVTERICSFGLPF